MYVGPVMAAGRRPFVVVELSPFERFLQRCDRTGYEPGLIGVFDAQDPLAAEGTA